MIIPIEKKDIDRVKAQHIARIIIISQIEDQFERAEKIGEEVNRFYRELSI